MDFANEEEAHEHNSIGDYSSIDLSFQTDYKADKYFNKDQEFLRNKAPLYYIKVNGRDYVLTQEHIGYSTYLTSLVNTPMIPYVLKFPFLKNEKGLAFELLMKLIYGYDLVAVPKSELSKLFLLVKELGIGKYSQDNELPDNCNPDFYNDIVQALQKYGNKEDFERIYDYGIRNKDKGIIKLSQTLYPFKDFLKQDYINSLDDDQFKCLMDIHKQEKENNIKKFDVSKKYLSIDETLSLIKMFPKVNENQKKDYAGSYCSSDEPDRQYMENHYKSIYGQKFPDTDLITPSLNKKTIRYQSSRPSKAIPGGKKIRIIKEISTSDKLDEKVKQLCLKGHTENMYITGLLVIGQYLISSGIDGKLIIRDIQNPEKILMIFEVDDFYKGNGRIKDIIEIGEYKIVCAVANILKSSATIWNLKNLDNEQNLQILENELRNKLENFKIFDSLRTLEDLGKLKANLINSNNTQNLEIFKKCLEEHLQNYVYENIYEGDKHYISAILEWPGNYLITASKTHLIFWNLSNFINNKPWKQIEHKGCECMLFHPKFKLIATSGKKIIVYNQEGNFSVDYALEKHMNYVNTMALLSDDLLVSGDHDQKCLLWNLSTKNCIREFEGHNSMIWNITSLSNNVFIAASKGIYFWDCKKSDPIHAIAFEKAYGSARKIAKMANNVLIVGGDMESLYEISF